MDYPVEKYFEFPLLKGEVFVAFLVPGVLCLVVHVDERRQKNCSTRCYDRDKSHIRQKLTWILGPQIQVA